MQTVSGAKSVAFCRCFAVAILWASVCISARAQELSNCLPGQPCSSQSPQDTTPVTMRPSPQDSTVRGQQVNSSQGTLYTDPAGGNSAQRARDAERQQLLYFPPDPLTDMQRLANAAVGRLLPIYGRDLFRQAPSTFAPADQIPSLPDYIVGPGDQLLVRLWGPESFNGELTVDSGGSVYIPQVGGIQVAGLRVDELDAKISAVVRHTFRNFSLSVNLGHLRSIQVYVVGEARRPGAYTVSALSTVLNVLFTSGGPNVNGSLRRIEVRRGGTTISTLDLYDLLLKGDRSRDIRLQSGDTIFIPATGPQVAIGGAITHPGIYELRDDTSIASIIELAGGFTPIGLNSEISLQRIDSDHVRAAFTVKLDDAGRKMALRNGDVLLANHMTAAFEQSVTIRGNLANPGKFPWHPGMRLSEIIPDRQSLLTNDYWNERNRAGLPTPLFEPLDLRPNGVNNNNYDQTRQGGYGSGNRQDRSGSPANGATTYGRSNLDENSQNTGDLPIVNPNGLPYPDPSQSYSGQYPDQSSYPTQQTSQGRGSGSNVNSNDADLLSARASAGGAGDQDNSLTRGTLADQQQAAESSSLATRGQRTYIKIPAPEIDWSFATIERLDPETLRNSLVPFNLGRLVQLHDSSQDLELRAGDVVTILSQTDIHVPQDEQTKYVHLEGEVKSAGVYSVSPGETLEELVARAGGLTNKAYLYGASFTRESARVFQQQRLDEYVTQLSIAMQREAAVRTASSSTGVSDPNALVEQRDIIAQFRKLRATGRIVLQFKPDSKGTESIPKIALEDGDILRIPSRPATVAVIGAVYGQNVFLHDPSRRVTYYINLAGKPNRVADRSQEFIIRADGSIFSRERTQGAFLNKFDNAEVEPGDAIVIPEKPVRPSAVRQLIDYSQIFSQLALGAAAVTIIK
jgi:polysaccharide export outer membrane protein